MRTRPRQVSLAAAGVAAAVLLALLQACTSSGSDGRDGTARTASATAHASTPPSLITLRDPHPCPDVDGFTCSTLRVPLDGSGRVPGHLDLAVAAADNVTAPRGVLLLLTGGPGQPGVPFVGRLAPRLEPVLDDYRLVMIDQRGTGANALVCPKLQEQLGTSDLFVPTPGAVDECARIIGDRRQFFSTENTVADLDLLRRALGEDKLTIDGVSYGTYVAERYAIKHPRRVARLVLDSVVSHEGVDGFLAVPMHATARVLRDVCADRACPGDPAKDLATVIRKRDDGSDILNVVTIWEFVSSDYSGIPEKLHQAAHGDMRGLDELIRRVREGVQVPAAELSQGLHASTLCADAQWPWGSAGAELPGRQADLDRAASRLDPATVWPFDVESAAGNGLMQTCLRWPPTRSIHPPERRLLPNVPTLLLGGDRDLSTPIEWLRKEAALAPGARSVIVDNATHAVQTQAATDKGRRAVYDFLSTAGG